MSSTSAKDLLAQADRLMRQRSPEELPVLTDLVIEEIEAPSLEFRSDAGNLADARARSAAGPDPAALPPGPPVWTPRAQTPAAAAPQRPTPAAPPRAAPTPQPTPMTAHDVLGIRPSMRPEFPTTSISAAPITASAVANVREQFNAQLTAKLEELQHSVFSQVMQQLELHAAGSLKNHIRETLAPALIDMARDIADQVAEDTSAQVRDVVSKAVDSEIARLREQLAKRRSV